MEVGAHLAYTTGLTAGQTRGLEKTVLSASVPWPISEHSAWGGKNSSREASEDAHHSALPTCMRPKEKSCWVGGSTSWVEAEGCSFPQPWSGDLTPDSKC